MADTGINRRRFPFWLRAFFALGFGYMLLRAALDLRGIAAAIPSIIFAITALPVGVWWMLVVPHLSPGTRLGHFAIKAHCVAFAPWAFGALVLAGWSYLSLGSTLFWSLTYDSLILIIPGAIGAWLVIAPVTAFFLREYEPSNCAAEEVNAEPTR
jgi:hypothetical protein